MAYTMAPTVYLSCLLALLVAGLAQHIKDSLWEKVSAALLASYAPPSARLPPGAHPLRNNWLYSHFSERATEAGEGTDMMPWGPS